LKQIPYATQWIDEEDIQAVVSALRLPYLTQGPLVAEFEKQVASYCGAKYAVAVSSGTAALHLACLAAGFQSGNEVITSPITFVASSNSVLYCGAKPVFADVEETTINIDPQAIARCLTKKTRGIIPVHFAGQPCELVEIRRLAKQYRLTIIEDAAHALGATYSGSKIGSCKYSDLTILSLHAVKHITAGEGGLITTNNKKLYEKLLLLRTHGITREPRLLQKKHEGPWYYEMQELGYNYRITDFQCALGMSQFKKLDRFIERRREIVRQYNQAFCSCEEVTSLDEKSDRQSSWHIYPIRVKGDRKTIFNKLREKGLGVNVHYLPVYLQPYYQKLGYRVGSCPRAENYYAQAITLPLYPKMSDEDVATVIEIVVRSIEENK
jgi:UDP-4-amino-4,6-dideoxy-N-acetyl-beta-L-altrosamine transaminase